MRKVKCGDCVYFVTHSKREGLKIGECRYDYPPYMHPYNAEVRSTDGCSFGIDKKTVDMPVKKA